MTYPISSPSVGRRALRLFGLLLGVPLGTGAMWVVRLSSRKAGVALMYHSVADRGGDPVRELVPAHGSNLFERQTRYLLRHYRVIPASNLLEAAGQRKRGQRFPAAITFDDDLTCHASVALPILPEERDRIAARLGEVLGVDPPQSRMRAADVRALIEAGMTVGFHTRRHDALSLLPDDLLALALEEGRSTVADVVGEPIATIGYPHGRADKRVANAARAAGFEAGFTTRGQPMTPNSDPLLQGRVGPSLCSVGARALELAVTLVMSGSAQATPAQARQAS